MRRLGVAAAGPMSPCAASAQASLAAFFTHQRALFSTGPPRALLRPRAQRGLIRGLAAPCALPGQCGTASVTTLYASLRAARARGGPNQDAQSTPGDGQKQPGQEQPQQQASSEGGSSTGAGAGDAEAGAAGGKGPNPAADAPKASFLQSLRQDVVQFPDIYNAGIMLNFAIWTIFCMASTGSAGELEWWLEHWGIDAAFRPLAWLLHSLLINNFMSMAFGIIVLHWLFQAALPGLGNRGLLVYLGIVSLVSGVLMWAFNYATNNRREKQYGPWDWMAALLVMHYMHQGVTPFAFFMTFGGWVKFANVAGILCIMYFDWQPTLLGAGVGYVLCRTRFRAPIVGAAGPK